MSITSDLRAYAGTAVTQGKHALDSAQAQLNELPGNAGQLYGKASAVVSDLRAQAGKAVNIDAMRASVEPYVQQAKGYARVVGDRAEGLISGVRNDKRVAQLVGAAGTVVDTVQQRVVQPVQLIAGHSPKQATQAGTAPTAQPGGGPASQPSAEPRNDAPPV